LIQALPAAKNLVPDIQLVLAAGSDDSQRDRDKEAELQTLAREIGVFDRIEWAQYIPTRNWQIITAQPTSSRCPHATNPSA
jgi:hypothetical protein